MKSKYLLILAIVLSIFLWFSFKTAYATSGCCSWHGGVSGCYNGRQVCNDGTLSPSCTCGGGYNYGATCTVAGKTYTNFGEANFAWDSDIDNAINRIFPIYLERQPTTNDYTWWENRFNFDNCHAEGYSDQTIIDEIKTGQEYIHLQWLKSHKENIKQAYIDLLDRTATTEEVDNWADNEDDINVIKQEIMASDEYQRKNDWLGYYAAKYRWWLIIIAGIVLYYTIVSYSENKNRKSNK